MLAGMTAEQYHKWHKLWLTEPFGDEWRQAALIAMAVQQPHTKKRLKVESYMPQVSGVLRRTEASPEELRQKLMGFVKQHNEYVKRGKARHGARRLD